MQKQNINTKNYTIKLYKIITLKLYYIFIIINHAFNIEYTRDGKIMGELIGTMEKL